METIDRTTRPHPLLHGPERAQLESWLEFSRATLLKKCSGLTAEQLKLRPIAASTLSLLGIVRHMTFVEQIWFDTRFAGNETVAYYVTHDDPDAEFNDLDGASLVLGGGRLVVSNDGTFLVPTNLAGTGYTTLFAGAPRLFHVLTAVYQAGTAGAGE